MPEVTHSRSRCRLRSTIQEYSPAHLCVPSVRSKAPRVTGAQSNSGLNSNPGFLVVSPGLFLLPQDATAKVLHEEINIL